jgi:hypothetical protein
VGGLGPPQGLGAACRRRRGGQPVLGTPRHGPPGLLQPVGYQAERRQLAQARRAVFLDLPTRRNRVWQTDLLGT